MRGDRRTPVLWRLLLLLVLGVSVLGISGCGGEEEAAEGEDGDGTKAEHEKASRGPGGVTALNTMQASEREDVASETTVTETNAGGGMSVEPGMLTISKLPYETVEIPVLDGMTIHGRLYDPTQKPESEDEEEAESEEDDRSLRPHASGTASDFAACAEWFAPRLAPIARPAGRQRLCRAGRRSTRPWQKCPPGPRLATIHPHAMATTPIGRGPHAPVF